MHYSGMKLAMLSDDVKKPSQAAIAIIAVSRTLKKVYSFAVLHLVFLVIHGS